MDNDTKVTEGHLTAMTSASSVLLGFSLYFFKDLANETGAWKWWEAIPLILCIGGFTVAILVSLYPSELKLTRMRVAWWFVFVGFFGFATIAIIYSLV